RRPRWPESTASRGWPGGGAARPGAIPPASPAGRSRGAWSLTPLRRSLPRSLPRSEGPPGLAVGLHRRPGLPDCPLRSLGDVYAPGREHLVDEDIDDVRVELGPPPCQELLQGPLGIEGGPVDPLVGHGVPRVG